MKILELAKRVRRDGWVNTITGLGMSTRDKSTSTAFYRASALSDNELDALFNDNDLAETIVSAIVDDALRQGIDIETDENEDDDQAKELRQRLESLDAVAAFAQAASMGRLFGGAAIYPVLDDGSDPSEPLDLSRVRAVYSLAVLDRRQLSPLKWYADPSTGKLGKVEQYMLTLDGGVSYSSPIVHESRLALFGGLRTTRTRKSELGGWDRSALQPVYDVLRQSGASFDGVMQLMADLSQAVWKVRGLMEMIAAGQEETMRARMEAVELARSAFRAIILDSEGEEFERKGTPLGGIDVLVDRMWQRLAAAARMPVTRLFGMSPAGLNATGESDARNWYDQVKAFQTLSLAPRATWLVQLIAASMGDAEPARWRACFPSLWQPTAMEQATLEKAVADKDKAYIDAGVLLPEEVTLSRFGSGKFSAATKVDVALRQKLLEAEMQKSMEPAPIPSETAIEARDPGETGSRTAVEKADAIEQIAQLAAAAADARRAGLEIDITQHMRALGAPVTGKVE